MLFSTDRYLLERERHDLALRLIHHEARTCTIRACTGLSDDRIRRLYRSYAHSKNITVRRRRGKAPRRIAFFTRNTQVQFEASLLASLFVSFGLLRTRPRSSSRSLPAVESTRLFCDAYETHRQLFRITSISLEHAWFLLHLLHRSSEAVQSVRCRQCDSHYLRDRSGSRPRACPVCRLRRDARRPRRCAIDARCEAGPRALRAAGVTAPSATPS